MAEEEKEKENKDEQHEGSHPEPEKADEHTEDAETHHEEMHHEHETEKPEPHEHATEDHAETAARTRFSLKNFVKTTKGKVTLAIVGVVVIGLVVLFAVPATRYGTLGMFIKKDIALSLVDSKTGKPVSKAQVDIPGQSVVSDNQGKVQFKSVPVGPQKVTVTKKYYKDLTQTVNVWITKSSEPDKISVEATGRQVPVKILSKISGQPVEKATVTAQESSTITDDKGEAVLIMPADKATLAGTVKVEGYNDLAVTITNTEQTDAKNTFNVVPAGKIYFLSKRTGKISVWKSDLDGTNAKEVVQGTGKEDDGDTILLASRDWRYLMLKAKRDSDLPKLYLIDTKTDKLSVADEGNAYFSPSGWVGHTFVYKVDRVGGNDWQGGQASIKSYNAENAQLKKLDTLEGGGADFIPTFTQNYYGDPILVGDEIVFEKHWGRANAPSQFDGKKTGVYSIKADGSGKKAIVETDIASFGGYFSPGYYEIKQYEAQGVYIRTVGVSPKKSYEYENSKLQEKSVSDADFFKAYPTYLLSPSGNQTFWSDSRDGKNTLLLGDKNGGSSKEIASLSDYRQYGWYSDTYLLISKNNSELYILDKDHPGNILKVTDYHKPNYSFFGYGGGYGGL